MCVCLCMRLCVCACVRVCVCVCMCAVLCVVSGECLDLCVCVRGECPSFVMFFGVGAKHITHGERSVLSY